VCRASRVFDFHQYRMVDYIPKGCFLSVPPARAGWPLLAGGAGGGQEHPFLAGQQVLGDEVRRHAASHKGGRSQ
jgi:hypothetical protein